MKASLRQTMSTLHTWTGLLPGWLLFVIFLFGTVAFFQQEISQWMRPELTPAPVSDKAIDAADTILRKEGAGADDWTLSLPGSRGGDGFSISWTPAGGDRSSQQERTLDATSGTLTSVRDTRGGFFLYRMHFDLHYMPVMWARLLVSLAALAMLVAILSGVVTHKKIFTDFFLLRFGKGQRSWLDAHNVTAVLALPFYLMITYTGLVTLLFTLMPWAISANFPSTDAYYEAAFPSGPKSEPSEAKADLRPIPELLQRARTLRPGFEPSYVSISHPGNAAAIVRIWPRTETLGGHQPMLYLNGATGEPLAGPREGGAATAIKGVMVDLHAGRYANPALRWLYFLSGVGGTIMVGSGLVLWTVKRRAKLPDPARPHFGFRLVERLNIGVIAGASAGIAVYFLANRLLDPTMVGRADWEVNALFIAWGAIFIWSLGRPARQAWVETLAACALLYAAIPLVNTATTPRGLPASVMAGDAIFILFDLMMILTATGFAFAARKVATHQSKAKARSRIRQPKRDFQEVPA
jgi:uncharacterized iron-regulated membrane protein